MYSNNAANFMFALLPLPRAHQQNSNRARALTDILERLVVLIVQEMYQISRTDLVRLPTPNASNPRDTGLSQNFMSEP